MAVINFKTMKYNIVTAQMIHILIQAFHAVNKSMQAQIAYIFASQRVCLKVEM